MDRKKFVKEWIKLLRSGKYIQIKDAYGTPTITKRCCAIGITKVLNRDLTRGVIMSWDFNKSTGTSIYQLNDDANFTFDEIADLLQAVYIEGALDA